MKLLTEEIKKKLPKPDQGDGTAYLKLFTPDADWTWYATEYDEETGEFFGVVKGMYTELGYFYLDEILKVRGALGLPVERDMHFEPKKVYQSNPFKILV